MTEPDATFIRTHEDRDMCLEAVNFTAAETGFSARLVEKDYFCTVLLEYLATAGVLVFKGGTCLAKVHAEFYRLSEDLDFVIPMLSDAARAERRAQAAAVRKTFTELSRRLEVFHEIEPLAGANRSTQYVTVIGYDYQVPRHGRRLGEIVSTIFSLILGACQECEDCSRARCEN